MICSDFQRMKFMAVQGCALCTCAGLNSSVQATPKTFRPLDEGLQCRQWNSTMSNRPELI